MKPHNPVEHVVIIVKENHSFDNYFGSFPGVNGSILPAAQDPPAGGDPRRDGYTGVLFVCEAIYAVRQLFYGSRQPVGAEPLDADRGRFAAH